MDYYMWLFAVKKLGNSYSAAIERYEALTEKEKLQLFLEFCDEQ